MHFCTSKGVKAAIAVPWFLFRQYSELEIEEPLKLAGGLRVHNGLGNSNYLSTLCSLFGLVLGGLDSTSTFVNQLSSLLPLIFLSLSTSSVSYL